MGIKDETPDDKVIFDSVDARMKYSKGLKVDTIDPCACHDCVYKENNPYKEPCGTCLSPLNDKNYYVKEGSVEAETIKNDIVKTESELDTKLNDIQDKVRQIYERQLLMYDMLKDVAKAIDNEYSCDGCKHYHDCYPCYGPCIRCLRNDTDHDRYEKED